jgi:uncharacterized protein (TIGR03437 family)
VRLLPTQYISAAYITMESLVYLRLCCAFLSTFPISAFGQTDSLTLSSGSDAPGGTVSLSLSLNSDTGSHPAAVQWSISYSPVDLSLTQVLAGPAALAAGKSVSCTGSAGLYACVLWGLNANTIADGVIAVLALSISVGATSSSSYIQIENSVAASPSGGPIPVSASGAAVAILHTQSPLSVNVADLATGAVGLAYTHTLEAVGGTPPYSWSLIGGSTPPGVILKSNGTFSGIPTAAGTFSLTVQLTDKAGKTRQAVFLLIIYASQRKGTISRVVNAASFQPTIAPGSWLSIMGSNLANSTRTWSADDIVNGGLPTQLDGVGVLVDGKSAFVAYISPTQINVQAPNDTTLGPVQVQVMNNGTASTTFAAHQQEFSPALFTWPGGYVAATHTNFTLAVKAGEFPSISTVPAKPNEVIILWGTGFGPTNPGVPAGQVVPGDKLCQLTNTPTILIGGKVAGYLGGALTPFSPGLYQLAIRVPADAPDGDLPVEVEIGGAIPSGALLTVKR